MVGEGRGGGLLSRGVLRRLDKVGKVGRQRSMEEWKGEGFLLGINQYYLLLCLMAYPNNQVVSQSVGRLIKHAVSKEEGEF